jgi:hypothetical protein
MRTKPEDTRCAAAAVTAAASAPGAPAPARRAADRVHVSHAHPF